MPVLQKEIEVSDLGTDLEGTVTKSENIRLTCKDAAVGSRALACDRVYAPGARVPQTRPDPYFE